MNPTVQQILAELACVDETDITPGTLLAEDLQLDSLDFAELAMKLEESVLGGESTITDEHVASWRTVQDVIATLEQLQPAGAQL